MQLRWTLTALTVAALGTACSSNELQTVNIESPFTCGQLNAQSGNYAAFQALAQQERLIASELTDDRAANFYFKHALVGATEFTTSDHNTYSQHRREICAKFPSKEINDAIVEAANLTFKEKGDRLVVQKCSALQKDQELFEDLVQGMGKRVNAHGLDIDMSVEIREALVEACASDPDQMIAPVLPRVEYPVVRTYNAKRESLEQQQRQALADDYVREHGKSLLVNGDVSCAAYNARREEQDRLNWALEGVDTQSVLRRDVEAVIEANYSGDDLLWFKRYRTDFLDLCNAQGVASFKAAAEQSLRELKASSQHEIFMSHVVADRERDPSYTGEAAEWSW